MTRIGLISAKHSPGVTTTAVALGLALSATTDTTVIEIDPAGGDIAATFGLRLDPGLVSLASSRDDASGSQLTMHSQRIGDLNVIVGPVSPTHMRAALTSFAATQFASNKHVIFDAGRFDPDSAAMTFLRSCDVIGVVMRPTIAATEHVRARADQLRAIGIRTGIICVGTKPYDPAQVAEAIDLPLLGVIAQDARGALALSEQPTGGIARRSALLRSAHSIVEALTEPALEAVGA